MLNSHVIMSNARYFSNDQQINPYYNEEVIDRDVAQNEHDEIRRCLEAAGVTVATVEAPSNSQDGVYTANWALVKEKKAVLARLPSARKAEESWAKAILESRGIDVVLVPEGLRFSGQGDALPCGNYLFCGSGYRSDVAAQKFAAEHLGYTRIQLQTLPQLDASGAPVINIASGWADSFYYDIDLALSIIKVPTEDTKGIIAYCPDAFTEESRRILGALSDFDTILVSELEAREAFACNLVSTGSAVVMSKNAPLLKAELEARGMHVHTPEIRELVKGGGYIRCTTLSLNY